MDTPERDSFHLKRASRLRDVVVRVDDEDEMNVMRGRSVRLEECIGYETGFAIQQTRSSFNLKIQYSRRV